MGREQALLGITDAAYPISIVYKFKAPAGWLPASSLSANS